MAASFGYTEQYVDEELDTETLFFHLDYIRNNPPAGTMLKLFFEAFASSKGGNKANKTAEPSNVSRSLEGFVEDFTGAGGSFK